MSWLVRAELLQSKKGPLVVYHGSPKKFRKFDMSKAEDGAHFFSRDPDHADNFGEARPYYLDIDNPLVIIDADLDAAWDLEHPEGEQDDRNLLPRDFVKQYVQQAKELGHDALIIHNMADLDGRYDVFLPFSPDQILPAPEQDYGDDGVLHYAYNTKVNPMTNPFGPLLRPALAAKLANKISSMSQEDAVEFFRQVEAGVIHRIDKDPDGFMVCADCADLTSTACVPTLVKEAYAISVANRPYDVIPVYDTIREGIVQLLRYEVRDELNNKVLDIPAEKPLSKPEIEQMIFNHLGGNPVQAAKRGPTKKTRMREHIEQMKTEYGRVVSLPTVTKWFDSLPADRKEEIIALDERVGDAFYGGVFPDEGDFQKWLNAIAEAGEGSAFMGLELNLPAVQQNLFSPKDVESE